MAKTTSKRKSESALPTGKTKQRKASKRDESDSSHSGDESSDQFFIQEQPLTPKYVKKSNANSRKSEPVPRVTRAADDEYEEDEGRLESQQFLALVEFESKKKKRAAKAASEYMEKFHDGIHNDEEALKKRLGDLSVASAKKDSDFLQAFEEAYAASRPMQPPQSDPKQEKGHDYSYFANLYERSKRVTAKSFNIVPMFENANSQTLKIESAGLMNNDWGEENETAAKLLSIGHSVGLEKFEASLMGEAVPEVDADSTLFAEAIYKPEEEILSMGWGKMAKKTVKVEKKLVKILPAEIVV